MKNTVKHRWGKKQLCPCGKSKNYQPITTPGCQGGGQCWSDKCGRKYFSPQRDTVRDTRPVRMGNRVHTYQDPDGKAHMQIRIALYSNGKKEPIAFRFEGGEWRSGVRGLIRYPYNLPKLIERISLGGVILAVEGEKDADRAELLGYTATTNPFGAGKWTDAMSQFFTGATVVVVQDNDDAGRNHAIMVRDSLLAAGALKVEILDLTTLDPKLKVGGDLSDYLDSGGSPELLRIAIDRLSGGSGDDNSKGSIVQPPIIPLDDIPGPLRDLLGQTPDAFQRTALLVAVLTVIGSILHNVRTRFHGRLYSPVLYLFVVGPPGSGKGAILPALSLVQPINDELTRRSREALRVYHMRVRQRDNSDSSMPPEEPPRQMLIVPADSTGPVIIRSICENRAILLFDSEADTINTALRVDTGSISSVLRKAWQGESISRARSKDNEYVSTDTPHFAMVLTGTPDQVVSLTSQVANGLLSRISFIEFPEQREYRDPFEESAASPYDKAQLLGEDIMRLWQFVNENDTYGGFEVVLTESQKKHFVEHYGCAFEDLIEDWDSATTLRAGITTARLATILTAIRHWFEHSRLAPRMSVVEVDFQLAMKIGEYLRMNTNSFVERFEVAKQELLPAQEKRKVKWFGLLPDEFDAQTAVRIGEYFRIGRATVFRILRNDRRIENIGWSKYRKIHNFKKM